VEAAFQLEDVITVQNPAGSTRGEIKIVIYTVDRDQDDNIGDQIQALVVNTECADTTSLALGRNYGTLMLTAFDNEEVGLQTMFAIYEITYAIENDSVFDAIITGALVSSVISGPAAEFVSPNEIPIGRSGAYMVLRESEMINLVDASLQQPPFRAFFFMNVVGRADTTAMVPCRDNSLFQLTIGSQYGGAV
jgi:hypothetical protein